MRNVILLILLSILYGCDSDDSIDNNIKEEEPDIENCPLTGTMWKCIGIVDVQTGTLTEFDTKSFWGEDFKKSFTLTFDTDSSFSTLSSSNEQIGDYTVDYAKQSFHITLLRVAAGSDTKDGHLFTAPFWDKSIHSFSLEEMELKLYYNDKDHDNKEYYLLFSKIDDDINEDEPIDNDVEDDEQDIDNGPLSGTLWKCVGIVDVETGILTEFGEDYVKNFTLNFETDSYFTGLSSSNYIKGHFKIDYAKQSFYITLFGGTLNGETRDGDLFINPFWDKSIYSFSLEEKELKLYYNNKDHDNKEYYLLFSKDEPNIENGPLTGTMWKCAGIVDVQTGTLTKIESKSFFGEDCEKCFTLTFDTDSYFSSWSSSNDLIGDFKIDYDKQSFYITRYGGTTAGETRDGLLFTYPFWKRFIHSFSFEEKELKLYYNDKDYDNKDYYLLFNKIEP